MLWPTSFINRSPSLESQRTSGPIPCVAVILVVSSADVNLRSWIAVAVRDSVLTFLTITIARGDAQERYRHTAVASTHPVNAAVSRLFFGRRTQSGRISAILDDDLDALDSDARIQPRGPLIQ